MYNAFKTQSKSVLYFSCLMKSYKTSCVFPVIIEVFFIFIYIQMANKFFSGKVQLHHLIITSILIKLCVCAFTFKKDCGKPSGNYIYSSFNLISK